MVQTPFEANLRRGLSSKLDITASALSSSAGFTCRPLTVAVERCNEASLHMTLSRVPAWHPSTLTILGSGGLLLILASTNSRHPHSTGRPASTHQTAFYSLRFENPQFAASIGYRESNQKRISIIYWKNGSAANQLDAWKAVRYLLGV